MNLRFRGWTIAAVVLTTVTTMGCDAPTRRPALTESSWDAALIPTWGAAAAELSVPAACPSVPITMHVRADGQEWNLTMGARGRVSIGGRLVADGADTYRLAQPVELPFGEGCAVYSLTATSWTISPREGTGDAKGARTLEGTGSGSAGVLRGDAIHLVPFSFTMTATPDVTPPRLTSDGVVNPLDTVVLVASEPMVVAEPRLLVGTTSAALKGVPDGLVFGTLESEQILPFAGSWVLSGDVRDLAGLPPQNAPTVTTLADPGVLIDGGFEDEKPPVAPSGEVRVVSALGTLPALNGSRSLFVAAGASATLHLARPVGTSAVRVRARVFATGAGPGVGGGIGRVGVIGGAERRPLALPAAGVGETGDPEWAFATPTLEITIPLADQGNDVVVVVAPWGFCQTPWDLCPRAVLVDDVRVE